MNKHTLYDCATASARLQKSFAKMGDILALKDALFFGGGLSVTLSEKEKADAFTLSNNENAMELVAMLLDERLNYYADIVARTLDDLAIVIKDGE